MDNYVSRQLKLPYDAALQAAVYLRRFMKEVNFYNKSLDDLLSDFTVEIHSQNISYE